MSNYDAWLERPYVEAAEQAERFEAWCESEDIDSDQDDAWDLYEEAMADLDEYGGPDPDDERDMQWDRDNL